MGKRFDQKTILVAGASGGLGRALCTSLAAEGANIIALARNEGRLAETQAAVEAVGGRCLCVPFDLQNFADYPQLFLALKDQIPHLDGLVHCAGSLDRCKPMQYIDFKEFRRMLDLHLTAPNMLTQSMLPLLKRAAHASVIFTTCEMAHAPKAHWHGYGLAKAALPDAASMWQMELPNLTIRFNSIDPGWMRTKLFQRAFVGLDIFKIAEPEQALSPFLYLLSDDSLSERGTLHGQAAAEAIGPQPTI